MKSAYEADSVQQKRLVDNNLMHANTNHNEPRQNYIADFHSRVGHMQLKQIY